MFLQPTSCKQPTGTRTPTSWRASSCSTKKPKLLTTSPVSLRLALTLKSTSTETTKRPSQLWRNPSSTWANLHPWKRSTDLKLSPQRGISSRSSLTWKIWPNPTPHKWSTAASSYCARYPFPNPARHRTIRPQRWPLRHHYRILLRNWIIQKLLRQAEGDEGTRHHHYPLHRQGNRTFFYIQIDNTYKQLGISTKRKPEI